MKQGATESPAPAVCEPTISEVDDYLKTRTGSSLRDWRGWARVQVMIELDRAKNEEAARRRRWKGPRPL